MELPVGYQEKVIEALFAQRDKYSGNDFHYARSLGLDHTIYNRLKRGDRERLLGDAKWMALGKTLGVVPQKSTWKAVETDVFLQIKEEILFCKEYSKSRIFVDNCGIGKSFTAKYMARTVKDCFYIDCTQCKKKNEFVRNLARVVGVEVKGKINEIKDNTKYYLTLLDHPVIIIDEAGALDKDALGLVQEYWNATEGYCGWYMMGANALRNKIKSGVSKDKDYFAELFSRFSENFSSIVPVERNQKQVFYEKLIRDVLEANVKDKTKLNQLVKQSLVKMDGSISGLRRAESLLILHNA